MQWLPSSLEGCPVPRRAPWVSRAGCRCTWRHSGCQVHVALGGHHRLGSNLRRAVWSSVWRLPLCNCPPMAVGAKVLAGKPLHLGWQCLSWRQVQLGHALHLMGSRLDCLGCLSKQQASWLPDKKGTVSVIWARASLWRHWTLLPLKWQHGWQSRSCWGNVLAGRNGRHSHLADSAGCLAVQLLAPAHASWGCLCWPLQPVR